MPYSVFHTYTHNDCGDYTKWYKVLEAFQVLLDDCGWETFLQDDTATNSRWILWTEKERTLVNGTTQKERTAYVSPANTNDMDWYTFDNAGTIDWGTVRSTNTPTTGMASTMSLMSNDTNWAKGATCGKTLRFFNNDSDDSFFVTWDNKIVAFDPPNGSWLERDTYVSGTDHRIERAVHLSDWGLNFAGDTSTDINYSIMSAWRPVKNPVQAITDIGGLTMASDCVVWYGYSADIKWKWQPTNEYLNGTDSQATACKDAGIVKIVNDYYVDSWAGDTNGFLLNCGATQPVIS